MQTPGAINKFEDRDPASLNDLALIYAKKACQIVIGSRPQPFPDGFAHGGFPPPLEVGAATSRWVEQKPATRSMKLDGPFQNLPVQRIRDKIKEAIDEHV